MGFYFMRTLDMTRLKLEEVDSSEEWYSKMLKIGCIGLTSQGCYIAHWVDNGNLITADSQDGIYLQGSQRLRDQLKFLKNFTLYVVVKDAS